MLTRRFLLAAPALGLAASARAATPPGAESFAIYLDSVRSEARRAGISPSTISSALGGLQPMQRAIDLDRNQPEVKLTWAQYRTRIVNDRRINQGRELYAQNKGLLARVTDAYGVPPGVIMGIWALESNYGSNAGDFPIIQCLATLAWEGRRRAFFQSELLDALRIVERGDVTAAKMVGSYAGAMGQTQFMPDSVLKYAVSFEGKGHPDLFHNLGDIFASTANYLAKEGFRRDVPWGRPVALPEGFDVALSGHGARRPLAEWRKLGVTASGLPDSTVAAVVLPGGPGEEAFIVFYNSYKALRSYNPPDKYCLCVGLLGDAITG